MKRVSREWPLPDQSEVSLGLLGLVLPSLLEVTLSYWSSQTTGKCQHDFLHNQDSCSFVSTGPRFIFILSRDDYLSVVLGERALIAWLGATFLPDIHRVFLCDNVKVLHSTIPPPSCPNVLIKLAERGAWQLLFKTDSVNQRGCSDVGGWEYTHSAC